MTATAFDREARDLVARVEHYLANPAGDDFDGLARAAFAFQHARQAPIRRLAAARGVEPSTVGGWREVPAVPVAAFKTTTLAVAPAVETFRSSGTTGGAGGGARSVHHHPFPDLYRRTVDLAFPRASLPRDARGKPLDRVPVLVLVPSREQAPDSSLGFMADHVVRRWGAATSRGAFGPGGVETEAATAWAAEQVAGPVLVFATAFALVQWLEALEAGARRLALPAGSVVFETGGFKGRVREVRREDLLARIERSLGVPARRVVREYGMSELTSQLYSRVLDGGDPDLFQPPHWMRLRVLDPASLAEQPAGEVGMIALFDLANVGSAVHLLTEDLGVVEPGGLRLLGRASGAELRGCSLTVEELRGER